MNFETSFLPIMFLVEWTSFLKYLVDQPDNDLNEHWDRQFTLCHPCHIHFDFVGKIEQADTEAPYMLDRFRFSGVPGVRNGITCNKNHAFSQ